MHTVLYKTLRIWLNRLAGMLFLTVLLCCGGIGGGVSGGGPPGGAVGAAPNDTEGLPQTKNIPGAPSGEIATKFDPTGTPTHQEVNKVDSCTQDNGHLKFSITGSIQPLPGIQEDTCDNRVVRLIDSTQHLFVDTITTKNSNTGVDCSFEEALDINTQVAAEWKFYVGASGITSAQLHVPTPFSTDNLLVLNNFSPTLGDSVFYNPDKAHTLSPSCPHPTALSLPPLGNSITFNRTLILNNGQGEDSDDDSNLPVAK